MGFSKMAHLIRRGRAGFSHAEVARRGKNYLRRYPQITTKSALMVVLEGDKTKTTV
jgi:hypothetical protein